MVFSSSSPCLAAKLRALIRHNCRSVPSRTTNSMAATTVGSAELRSVSKSAFVSLMAMRLAPKLEKLEALVLGGAEKLAAITVRHGAPAISTHASSRRRANCEVIE